MWSFFKTQQVSNHRELVRDGALLLDVRTPSEFAARHVQGALNIPVDSLPQRIGELGAKRTIVVYCGSGARSARASRELRARGHEVHDIGGIGNW